MACLFPQAGSLQEYWENIYTGRDCLTDVPLSRWDISDYFDPSPAAPDKTYSRRGGFIPDTEFDPLEFGLPPNILEVTDTSQLLSLVVAKQALQDAGYGSAGGRTFDRERTGVVLGVGGGQKLVQPLTARLQYPAWQKVLRSSGISAEDTSRIVEKMKKAYVPWDENAFPGLLGNVIAGRIANRFDLGGLNCVVDAACASSLAAVEMAISELTERRVDMIISGGVDTDNSIFMYMCFSKTPAFSHADHLKPFDAESDGMMVGEGIGMVVLKRLDDAEQDGDRIYATIQGIGSSSDGRFKSIYSPRSEGQARALRRAHASAGIAAGDVDLIEAHGTGTVAGDLVEATTLRQVFGDGAPAFPHVALGSVKSQIGHTKAAAGAAGLIKAALALHHKVLPATINVTTPHPALGLTDSPIYLNTEMRPWMRPATGGPRRAGVSSFGFGGSNYHAVLQEYEDEHRTAYRLQVVPCPVVLSAPNRDDLLSRCSAAISALEKGEAALDELTTNGSHTPIPTTWPRLGFTARTATEARERLETGVELLRSKGHETAWESPLHLVYRSQGLDLAGRVAALFPGQGSQYVNMGRELAATMPPVRDTLALMDSEFRGAEEQLLSNIVYPPAAFDDTARREQAARLQATALAQPAIGAFSAALFRLLGEAGFRPDFTAGHSFGELTALWAAGAMDLGTFFALARARGRAMAPPSDPTFDPGCMIAVRGDARMIGDEIAQFTQVRVANLNAPDQVVLAGPRHAVDTAQRALRDRGFAVIQLPVAAAFHTPLVAHAQAPFADAVSRASLRKPCIPIYANSTGLAYPPNPDEIRATLSAQMSEPVRFQEQIENLYAAGAYLFVECGPGTVLTTLVRRILQDRPHLVLSLNGGPHQDSDLHYRDALVQLRVAGLPIRLDDPYRRPVPPSAPRRATTILLNGSNYVSDKTRRAFEEALNDGHQVSTAHASPNGHGAPPGAFSPIPPPPEAPAALPAPHVMLPAAPAPAARLSEAPAQWGALEHVTRQQTEAVRTHQQYLSNETEYIKSFQQIMQQQQALLLAPDRTALPPGVIESLSQSLALFHQHQGDTNQVHRQYLEYQAHAAQALFSLVHHTPSASGGIAASEPFTPAAPTIEPPPVPAPPHAQSPLSPLAQPSPPWGEPGYGPADIPRPSAAPQHSAPPLATPTLPLPAVSFPPPAPAPEPISPSRVSEPAFVPAPPVAAPSQVGLGRDEVSAGLLQIVSEKTGYPVETLELEMDMEADLGIDSIKRVEILGATQERFPDAPQLRPEELAERRTLAQIVDYVVRQMDSAGASPAAAPLIAESRTTSAPWSPVVAQPLPPPDRLEIALSPGYCCLLSDDGTALTSDLAGAIHALGWRVAVIAPSMHGVSLPPGIPRIEMTDSSEFGVATLIESVAAGQGTPAVFIHLAPPAAAMTGTEEEAMVRRVFALARYLQPSIASGARAGFGAFLTVTRIDGALGTTGLYALNGASLTGAVSGGLPGLVKTLRAEWPGVFCRAIDVSPEVPAANTARLILAELLDPNRSISEVGYTGDSRLTLATGEVSGAPSH